MFTGHCRDDMLSYATTIQVQPSASFHYHHQIGRHHLKTEACSTMFYNSSAKK
jgi:hypothetical protein